MKNNNVPLYLWLLWCTLCLYITTPWQYLRYPYTDNLSLPYMLYFCVVVVICIFPLLFRCVLLIVRSASKYDLHSLWRRKREARNQLYILAPMLTHVARSQWGNTGMYCFLWYQKQLIMMKSLSCIHISLLQQE